MLQSGGGFLHAGIDRLPLALITGLTVGGAGGRNTPFLAHANPNLDAPYLAG